LVKIQFDAIKVKVLILHVVFSWFGLNDFVYLTLPNRKCRWIFWCL